MDASALTIRLLSKAVGGSIVRHQVRAVGVTMSTFASRRHFSARSEHWGKHRKGKDKECKNYFLLLSGDLKIFEFAAARTDGVVRMKVPCVWKIRFPVNFCWKISCNL